MKLKKYLKLELMTDIRTSFGIVWYQQRGILGVLSSISGVNYLTSTVYFASKNVRALFIGKIHNFGGEIWHLEVKWGIFSASEALFPISPQNSFLLIRNNNYRLICFYTFIQGNQTICFVRVWARDFGIPWASRDSNPAGLEAGIPSSEARAILDPSEPLRGHRSKLG